MAKKKKSLTRRLLTYCIATAVFGSGAGGLTFPDMPLVGPAVQTLVQSVMGSPEAAQAQADLKEAVRERVVNSEDPKVSNVVGTIHAVAAQVASATSGAPIAAASPSDAPLVPLNPAPANVGPASPAPPGSVITIATFNIQVFGTAKLNETWVANILADVVRRFDVVAIQEVRTQDDTLIPRFVQMVNSRGARYHYAIGPRLGRTVSKEQYTYIYNTDRLDLDPRSVLTIGDPQDNLHREPLLARFSVRGLPPQQGFSFWLIDIHTDPDETKHEIDVLADVFTAAQRDGWGEDDIILLGDFNAAPAKWGALAQLPGMTTVITTQTTNTRGNATYDNICFTRPATSEYTGEFGIVNLMQQYQLSVDQALKVSDHMPVWAAFSAYEAGGPGPLARNPR